MKQTIPLAITISRQLGCGGAYIGRLIANKLDIDYADREILSEAAKHLAVLEEDMESRDEKLLSFWQSFFYINRFATDAPLPAEISFPFDREIFNTEAGIIERIAKERSAVIIGRCGFHILREYPNHVSLFLYADLPTRSKRIQRLYNVSEKAAMEMITRNDKERAQYIETYTNKKWTDAMQFNLCLDTGKLGFDKSAELILNYLKSI